MADEDRYRLAPVRAGRARDEAASRGELADAIGDARATEAAIAAAERRVAATRETLAHAVAEGGGATALERARGDVYAARLRRDVERAEAEHAGRVASHRDRLAVIDAARGRLAAARARREAVERHFARWREERRKLAERRAD